MMKNLKNIIQEKLRIGKSIKVEDTSILDKPDFTYNSLRSIYKYNPTMFGDKTQNYLNMLDSKLHFNVFACENKESKKEQLIEDIYNQRIQLGIKSENMITKYLYENYFVITIFTLEHNDTYVEIYVKKRSTYGETFDIAIISDPQDFKK